MNADNHIASAWPSLFSVQHLIKFSLYGTRRIVKFLSLGRLPKESTQDRGPLKRFVTIHQASNNLCNFCINEECAPSSGQVVMCYWSSSAQPFLVLRPVGTRDDICILSRPFMCFEMGGPPLFDEWDQVFG
jgi:hypothetical protein